MYAKRGSILIFVLILVIIFGLAFLIYWIAIKNKTANNLSSAPTASTANTALQNTTETWKKFSDVLFDATSTDTHKLADGTYRTYLMQEGQIVYADSKDAITYSAPMPTGITEDAGMMISNPAVIETTPGNWIMIYEMSPIKQPGQKEKMNGKTNQRNLYMATSTDGKNFTKSGIAIDSSKEDNYFASVPDLIKLSDGKIRMYYVSGGEAIGSAISADNGKTWTRETGYRLQNMAVDPDVMLKQINGKDKYVMYYSVLSGPGNKILKSTSADGLNWTEGQTILEATDTNTSIIDPDVVEIDANHYRMLFGEMSGDSATSGAMPKLYYADINTNIFN